MAYPRRSFLYAPANDPSIMRKALASDADGVTLDLEDTVPDAEIESARESIIEAIATTETAGTEVAVRINDLTTSDWLQDLETAVTAGADTVRLPMIESARQVHTAVETARQFDGETPAVILTLETPTGILNSRDIVQNCTDLLEVSGISTGIGDYAQAVSAEPNAEVRRFLDHQIVAVAAVGSVTPIASVYTDVGDLDGLRELAERSREIGYVGQSAIHPDQVPVINEVYTPSADRVDRARRVVGRFDDDESDSITVDGEFVDTPIADRYRRVLERHRTITDADEA